MTQQSKDSRPTLAPWERYFVLMAFHLLWDNWPADSGHPHNDDIGSLLEKIKCLIGADE